MKIEARIETALGADLDVALANVSPSIELELVEHGLMRLVVDAGAVEEDYERDKSG